MVERPTRPTLLQVNPTNIPDELRSIQAWVGWRLVLDSGHWTKKPVDIKTGKPAGTDRPTTWCDFETAIRNYRQISCDGIGLCRTADFVFIDCDGVLNHDGTLLRLPWAEKILCAITGHGYLEKSVSGTGIHGIVRGTLPAGRRQFDDRNRGHTGYAFYDKSRFFTVSGCVLPGSAVICDLTPELAALHRDLLPSVKNPRNRGGNDFSKATAAFSLDDSELLERARRAKNGDGFSRLWDGNWSGYPSQSEADFALCRHLAYWTARDIGRIGRLFRLSGLMRKKWLREDYRAKTMSRACQATTDVWEPRLSCGLPETTAEPLGFPACADSTANLKSVNAGTETVCERKQSAEQHMVTNPREALLHPAVTSRFEELAGRKTSAHVDNIATKSETGFQATTRNSRICCNGRQLRDISADALRALQAANNPPKLFARGGAMVAVLHNENHRQVIAGVGNDALCSRLARCADYFSKSAKGDEYDCPPPSSVVKDILALAPEDWNVPPLDAVTAVPILRPDGSILDRTGYDAATRLYYAPDPNLHIPAVTSTPSSDNNDAAISLIEQAIGEFPYADQASRANAWAAMLTPIIKPAINAPTPIGLVSAPQAGTGKSLLCDVIAIIATGRAGEMFSAPKDEEEWRKVITTALLSDTTVVIFDNVTRPLENQDLCKVLTATTWGDRMLKTQTKIALPVKATFLASGNNIRLAGDMPRRCYQIRLDAKCSAPFLRTGPEPGHNFRIEDLKAWTREYRGELVAACLTLVRAWFVAGKPKSNVTPLGSFESWSTMLGGILTYAGVHGFMGNAMAMYHDVDDESREWEAFLFVLHEIFNGRPFTVADIANKLGEKTAIPGTPALHPLAHASGLKDALPALLAEVSDRDASFRRRTGKAFAKNADRRFGGSGVHLKKGNLLTGRQVWEIIRP